MVPWDIQPKPMSRRTKHKGRNETIRALKGRNPIFSLGEHLAMKMKPGNGADGAVFISSY